MNVAMMGSIGVLLLWMIILIPVVRGLVRFVRTTRLADLAPRITRVRGRQ